MFGAKRVAVRVLFVAAAMVLGGVEAQAGHHGGGWSEYQGGNHHGNHGGSHHNSGFGGGYNANRGGFNYGYVQPWNYGYGGGFGPGSGGFRNTPPWFCQTCHVFHGGRCPRG